MAEEKKLIIDEDWKSQVEAEKSAAQAEPPEADAAPAEGDPNDPPMPPASYTILVSTLATEAMMALGQMPHPVTGEVTPRRNQAKYLIDTLAMLSEKTKGNVSDEETAGVEELLNSLKMAFVGMAQGPASPPPASE